MTRVAIATGVAAARRAVERAGVDVLLGVTCDEPVELAPRTGDDAVLRGRAAAAGIRVVELADLVDGQHPLAWSRADLVHDEERVRDALGAVDVVEVAADDEPAAHVAHVLRALYPDVRVRTPDGHVLAPPPPAPAPTALARGLRRVLRAGRVRVHEAVVVVTAWRDLASATPPDEAARAAPMLAPPDPPRGGA